MNEYRVIILVERMSDGFVGPPLVATEHAEQGNEAVLAVAKTLVENAGALGE